MTRAEPLILPPARIETERIGWQVLGEDNAKEIAQTISSLLSDSGIFCQYYEEDSGEMYFQNDISVIPGPPVDISVNFDADTMKDIRKIKVSFARGEGEAPFCIRIREDQSFLLQQDKPYHHLLVRRFMFHDYGEIIHALGTGDHSRGRWVCDAYTAISSG